MAGIEGPEFTMEAVDSNKDLSFDSKDIQEILDKGNDDDKKALKESFDKIGDEDKTKVLESLKKGLPASINRGNISDTYAVQIIAKLSGQNIGPLDGSWGVKTETAYNNIKIDGKAVKNDSKGVGKTGESISFKEQPEEQLIKKTEVNNKEIQLKSGATITFDERGGIVLNKLNKGTLNKLALFSEVLNLIDKHGATVNVGGKNITFTQSDMKKMKSNVKANLINLYIGGNSIEMKQQYISQVQDYLKIKAPVEYEAPEGIEKTDKVEWQYLLLNRDKLVDTSKDGVQKMNINGDNYYVTTINKPEQINLGMANIKLAVALDTGNETVSVAMLRHQEYDGKNFVISKV